MTNDIAQQDVQGGLVKADCSGSVAGGVVCGGSKRRHQERVGCWPWHLWRLVEGDGHPNGAHCNQCGRDIAVPKPRKAGVCIYCALTLGLDAAVDEPLCGE